MSSVSKIVITGQVVREPEKRFTENDIAISSFTVDFGTADDEKVIRVFSLGKTAEEIAQKIKKGQRVVIDGRLQTNSVKTDSGEDKKFFEINAQSVEVLAQSGDNESSGSADNDTDFDFGDDISSDDLIGKDEIPF